MSDPFVIVVAPAEQGNRLDRCLVARAEAASSRGGFAGLSRARFQRLIEEGHVTLDGRLPRASQRLSCGQTIVVHVPEPAPAGVFPEAIPLDVLFEDEDLIAVNKPAGMLVHPGAGHAHGTLVHALLAHCRDLSGIGGVLRPGIVHRLDRGTSGVIIAAKNDRAHEALSRQFARRQVRKSYLAFAYGCPNPARQKIDTFFARHPVHRKRFTSRVDHGRRAITQFETFVCAGGLSMLAVTIDTGRTHQIRVHLCELGHPIAADPLYGRRRPGVLDPALQPLVSALSHQALHAAAISLLHPIRGTGLSLEAPLRPELLDLEAAMRSIAANTTWP